jgi:UDP-N-acetylmuramate: L-alanyl-gamma-D-glutamyl-meso-diaminopimelate ligase
MKIHLIAIGGSIMHNLAIALKEKGYEVTGSDDEIYEPAKSRLDAHDLLPENMGWFPGKITYDLDIVILGMHAKKDNPELLKALELGLVVVSFPQFIYYLSQFKKRVVIAGSHGKTTITAMVMHVLKRLGKDFDYAVGSNIPGFENSVSFSKSAPIMVIEGDEYLSSPIDRQPKFLWYKPQIAYINGVAWDHINVFPTYQDYLNQFINFIDSLDEGAKLIYNSADSEVVKLVKEHAKRLELIPTEIPFSFVEDDKLCVVYDDLVYELNVFGQHNLQNLAAAQKICEQFNIEEAVFWDAVEDFKGAGKRLEKIYEDDNAIVFRDFAHAPSKVKATVNAVKNQFADRKLLAILELHTFSSLNPEFIKEYKSAMDEADKAIVYINPETQKAKRAEPIGKEELQKSFGREDLMFVEESGVIKKILESGFEEKIAILLMSSGNFGGLKLDEIFGEEETEKEEISGPEETENSEKQ